ncbi:MAG: hypothetical protein K9N49_06230 [Candidatus Marinimicrobia bacterium]|nr:hypothetical protein [Candidatus Neomarinimicrobiota bacterium]
MNKPSNKQSRILSRRRPAARIRSVALFLLWGSAFILHPSSFAADVPVALNYQGVLADAQGVAVTSGYYHLEFRIWDHPTATGAGSLIWGRAFPLHVTAGGVFHILLTDDGGEVSHPSARTNDLRQAFQEDSRYLGLTVTRTPAGAVSDPEEFLPRQPLTSVPYAFHSQYAADAAQATRGFRVEGGLVVASGGLDVTNAAVFNDTLAVAGAATVDGTLRAEKTMTVHGAADLHRLHVTTGGAQFDSAVAVTGNLTVSAPSRLDGNGTIPIGGIIPWSGAQSAIPDGWALCDGGVHAGHATPDLRNLFVVGAGSHYTVGATGGENAHRLTVDELPRHTHSYTRYDELKGYVAHGTGGYFWRYAQDKQTSHAGGNAPHENRPPFYALCLIMRVK